MKPKTAKPPRRLNELVRYNPRTGKFHWIITTHGRYGMIYPGDEAGALKDGYLSIKIDAVAYRVHRLAWYVMTDEWLNPDEDIDHINGDRSDNRWSNLRKATRSENMLNPINGLRSDNESGTQGVSWRADTEKWHARITIGGKTILLGDYAEKDAAIAARKTAEREYSSTRRVTVKERLRSDNTSGHRGVDWDQQRNKWSARIMVGGRTIHLGRFAELEDAIAARKAAERS